MIVLYSYFADHGVYCKRTVHNSLNVFALKAHFAFAPRWITMVIIFLVGGFLVQQLQLQQLGAQRGHKHLYQDVCVNLVSGDCLWLQGPNGAGKSTFLSHVAGVYRQGRGTVQYQQSSRIAAPCYFSHQLGFASKSSLLHNVQNFLLMDHISYDAHKAEGFIKELGLEGLMDIPLGHLSQGQKRKALWLCLFLARSGLWLLDEAFSALDQKSIVYIVAQVKSFLQDGGMIIFTDHQKEPILASFVSHKMELVCPV